MNIIHICLCVFIVLYHTLSITGVVNFKERYIIICGPSYYEFNDSRKYNIYIYLPKISD